MIELSLGQKIILRIQGHVRIGSRKYLGWKDPLPHYAFKCQEHGIVVTYPSGFGKKLICPKHHKENSK